MLIFSAVFLLFTSTALSHNILFYFATSPLSHRFVVWPLIVNLLHDGHNITYFSSNNLANTHKSDPRIHEVSVFDTLQELNIGFYQNLWSMRISGNHSLYWDLESLKCVLACQDILKSKEIQRWLVTSQFDVVVVDVPNNDCGLGIAAHFKSRIVYFSAKPLFMSLADSLGIPSENSWYPDMQYPGSHESMGYLQRVYTTWRSIRWHLYMHAFVFPQHQKLFLKAFPSHEIALKDVEKNISLIFLNSDSSEGIPRPLPPFVVPVGGLHLFENLPLELPKEMRNFLGNDQFVYVNLQGTTLGLSEAPLHIIRTLEQGFEETGHKFLIVSDLPTNVAFKSPKFYVTKWAPQHLLLAHEHIRVFINAGGSMSIQEAMYFGVPMIIIPVFPDADFNYERVSKLGIAMKLDIDNLHRINDTLHVLFLEERYKRESKQVSYNFRSRPQEPLKLCLWWFQKVLSSESLLYLKSQTGVEMPWFKRRLIDVYFGIFVFSVLLLGIVLSGLYYTLAKLKSISFPKNLRVKDKGH